MFIEFIIVFITLIDYMSKIEISTRKTALSVKETELWRERDLCVKEKEANIVR